MTRKITRRRFLKLVLGSTAAAGLSTLGGVGYARLVEPHWLAVERVDVPIPDLPASLDGFTIVQLSDLHRGPKVTQEQVSQAVELALRQEADRPAEPLPRAQAEGRSRRSLVVLACLGNHDHWTDADAVAGALTDAGITVLRNAAREVADGLWVAAVDDVWERYADLEQALEAVPAGVTIVLLAHEPDYADEVAADGRVSLQLSGHSHGGQVRLPLAGPLVLPYLGRKYPAGLYRVGDMWLYVNRGVGLIGPAVRFNCRPEVTVLRLRCPAA
ncbi:MAG: metallophosphoesterase [Anaerolineae bacterium]